MRPHVPAGNAATSLCLQQVLLCQFLHLPTKQDMRPASHGLLSQPGVVMAKPRAPEAEWAMWHKAGEDWGARVQGRCGQCQEKGEGGRAQQSPLGSGDHP